MSERNLERPRQTRLIESDYKAIESIDYDLPGNVSSLIEALEVVTTGQPTERTYSMIERALPNLQKHTDQFEAHKIDLLNSNYPVVVDLGKRLEQVNGQLKEALVEAKRNYVDNSGDLTNLLQQLAQIEPQVKAVSTQPAYSSYRERKATEDNYEPSLDDHAAIRSCEFCYNNDLSKFMWFYIQLLDHPKEPELKEAVGEFCSYWTERADALQAAISQLATSQNRDVRALAPEYQNSLQLMRKFIEAMNKFQSDDDLEDLMAEHGKMVKANRPQMMVVGGNPAYNFVKDRIPEKRRKRYPPPTIFEKYNT